MLYICTVVQFLNMGVGELKTKETKERIKDKRDEKDKKDEREDEYQYCPQYPY